MLHAGEHAPVLGGRAGAAPLGRRPRQRGRRARVLRARRRRRCQAGRGCCRDAHTEC